MDVLVIGGTGFIGARLCRELNNDGHQVTALARNPQDANLPDRIETVSGDVTAYETIVDAFEGVDAVVNLVALSPLFAPQGGERMHDVVHRGGTKNVVRAAEAAGVERLVQVSAVNADPDGPTSYLRAKGRAEELVREASLSWVTVRPSVMFGTGGEFISFTRTVAPPYLTPLPGGGRTRFQPIWVGDMIPILVEAATEERYLGSVYEIGGPEVLSLAEIAELVHVSAGRSTTVLPIPMSLVRVGMSLGSLIPGFPFGPDQYRSLTMDLVPDRNDVEAFGLETASLATLAEYLGDREAFDRAANEPAPGEDQRIQAPGRPRSSE